MASGYEKQIWDFLVSKIGNEYGAAALMGNLYAESGLYPNRVQGDIPYSNYSVNYTSQVDSGAISKNDFVHNGPNGGGYGLAQWTYYTRKEALYNKWKSGVYSSIGSITLALDFLWYELTTYSEFAGVLSTLKNASSIREASDKVLFKFENPEDKSEAVQALRESYGRGYYDQFAGSGGGGGSGGSDDVTGGTIPKAKKMSLLLLWAATKRR